MDLLEAALAFAGAASALTGLAQFVWPALPTSIGPRIALGALLAAGLPLAIAESRRRALVARPRGLDWSIEVAIGDIFDESCRALTADRTLTTDQAVIGKTSLLGQLLDRSDPDVASIYIEALKDAAPGPDAYVPGHVICLENGVETTMILTVGMSTKSGSTTTWQELWMAYDGLWAYVRSRNAESFAMPVIGAGYSGTSLDHGAVVASILTSFHSSSIERVVSPRLRLVIAPDSAGALRSAGKLLNALGYEVKYKRRLAPASLVP